MPWYDDLDKRQKDAASHSGSHARLLAGPGTGKTVTLTRRLVKLILEDGVDPNKILAVAFTRINAFDLRRTLIEELEDTEAEIPPVRTLHSYALRQLLLNSQLITTLPQPLRIADDFEEKHIIRQDLRGELNLSDNDIKEKFADLSSDWESLTVENDEYQPADPQFMGAWQNHRNLYGYTLRSELIWQLKHAFEENPDNFKFEGDIEHLIVDEYQDLNKCDLAIIRKLADLGAEVYCAGDDDQSIYGFRRAHPVGIRRFTDEYQPSSSLELEICWRSDRRIIEVGQFVANQDPRRLPKPMEPREGAGLGSVHLLRFSDQYQEAYGISRLCIHLIEDQGYEPDEILILLRSDHRGRYSDIIGEILLEQGLDYKVRADPANILDTRDGRMVLCLIRLSVDINDDLAWRTVFQYCGRKNQIGDATIASVVDHAITNGLRFHTACFQIKEDTSLIQRGSYIKREIEVILPLIEKLSKIEVNDLEGKISEEDKIAARENLIDEVIRLCNSIIQDEGVRRNIVSYISEILEQSNSLDPTSLLSSLSSPEDTLDQELDEGKINILTMHRAKGLSSKAVFIVAAEEQLIPGGAVGDDFNDARRLLYVSLTRAREFLCISYCNQRTGSQSYSGSQPGVTRRSLTPFLRGALPVTDGENFPP